MSAEYQGKSNEQIIAEQVSLGLASWIVDCLGGDGGRWDNLGSRIRIRIRIWIWITGTDVGLRRRQVAMGRFVILVVGPLPCCWSGLLSSLRCRSTRSRANANEGTLTLSSYSASPPQASSLDAKSSGQTSDSFNPRTTVLSEDSGLNESGVTDGGFPGAQVQVGRGGMTGGGTNPQNIPPEEGGDDRAQRVGETSARFEGEGDLNDKRREVSASVHRTPSFTPTHPLFPAHPC